MRLQVGIAEARVYPLLVTGSQFGHDVDLRLADIAHVLGSSPVMSPACDVTLQGLICMLDFVAIFLNFDSGCLTKIVS